MDGLALAEEVSRNWPLVKFIFLSGYDEFAYVQRALQIKAFSYLTKPAPYAEILGVVRTAIAELEADYANLEIVEEARRQVNAMIPILQERYLKDWIVNGRCLPSKTQPRAASCRLKIEVEQPAFFVLLRIDGQSPERLTQEPGYLEAGLQQIARQLLDREKERIFFNGGDNHYVVCFQEETIEALERQHAYVSAIAETLQHMVCKTLKQTVSIFIGEMVENPDQGHQAYLALKKNCMLNGIAGEQGIIVSESEHQKDAAGIRVNPLHEQPSLRMLMEACQEKEALEKIHTTFAKVREVQGRNLSEYALRIYQTVCSTLLDVSARSGALLTDWADGLETPFFNYTELKSLDALETWCCKAAGRLIQYIARQQRLTSGNLVRYVKQRLYSDDKNVQVVDLAKELYVHPNYLSRVFKKETGLSITDFTLQIRIEEAKRLLRQPGMKIYQVAQTLGYESNAYFNRLFKRQTGMTPKEYQIRH
jgi:two-component system response regulator YesN